MNVWRGVRGIHHHAVPVPAPPLGVERVVEVSTCWLEDSRPYCTATLVVAGLDVQRALAVRRSRSRRRQRQDCSRRRVDVRAAAAPLLVVCVLPWSLDEQTQSTPRPLEVTLSSTSARTLLPAARRPPMSPELSSLATTLRPSSSTRPFDLITANGAPSDPALRPPVGARRKSRRVAAADVVPTAPLDIKHVLHVLVR